MGRSRSIWIVRGVWYLLALFAAFAYAESRSSVLGESPSDLASWFALGRVLAGLVLILASFALVHVVVRKAIVVLQEREPPRESVTTGFAFPDGVTLLVGGWLLAFAILTIVGLLFSMGAEIANQNLKGAAVAMTAAGIGGAVATILGYLKHASDLQDFDMAYVPWYVARPVMGLLLGLIFFLLLKAGLLATYPNVAASDPNVNEWGVAGIGSLVGLFSKPAIDKLREVFNVLFRTETERDEELLERLPPKERERIRPYLQGLPELPSEERSVVDDTDSTAMGDSVDAR